MNNKYLKFFLPHLISFIVLLLVAGVYFSPAFFQGKVLTQSDVVQAKGMQAEMRAYKEKTGRTVLWTNSMFSGMPTYQIWGGQGKTYNVLGRLSDIVFRLNKKLVVPYALVFTLSLGFYLLLITFGIDWKIGLAGALLFGLSTSHIHLIEGGHLTKVLAMAYLAPSLAGALLAFRGRYVLGAALFALFMNRQLAANHVQITFYFLFVLSILGIVELARAIKEKKHTEFIKAAGALIIAMFIAIMPNLPKLLTTSEYSEETIRGKSELVKPDADGSEKASEGLDKSYAFSWSLGKLETFSLLIPNFMGATSSENFVTDDGSNTLKALRSMGDGQKANELVRYTGHYWGEQPFTSGAMYYGSVMIFLFFLGAFLVSDPRKWWLISSLVLLIMFAWGRHFAVFNFFLFDHFPLFNKFRAVTMAAGIGHIMVVFLGIWGLKELVSDAKTKAAKVSALFKATAAAGGLCILAILIGYMLTPSGPNDNAIFAAYPNVLQALHADRHALLLLDSFRSLAYIVAAASLCWLFMKNNFKPTYLIGAIAIIALIDIWSVDRRYLNTEDFLRPSEQKELVKSGPANEQINADPDPHFRVLDLSTGGNPFSNAMTSYFHKSVGGYHAAKLMIYQELIDRYLLRPGENTHILGMLNTKYIIGNFDGTIRPSPVNEALGNAWFVNEVKLVDNANAELDSLANFNPANTAFIHKKYADYLLGFTPSVSANDNIRLTKYEPDRMVYESNTTNEALAIFSEVYYPPSKGWKVFIDDQPVDGFVKANYVLRALRVPAGSHKIEMRFEPRSFYLGQTLGQIGSLLLVLLFIAGIYTTIKDEDLMAKILPEPEEEPVVTEPKRTVSAKRRTTTKRKKKK